jgi:hypothetical protein
MKELVKEMTLKELTNEKALEDRVYRAREALLERGIKVPEPELVEAEWTCASLQFGAGLMYQFALMASEQHLGQDIVDWYLQAGIAFQQAVAGQCP